MQVKLPKFKIRASAASKIMTGTVGLTESQQKELDSLNDRKKDAEAGVEGVKPLTATMEKKRKELFEKYTNPVLPKTLTSYCDTWIKEQLYSRRKEFRSKYTDKGNIVEDNSLDFIGEQIGEILVKNEESFEDEYKTGTPDALPVGLVVDAKSSWDCFTFPLFMEEPDPDYYGQGQVYMDLTGVHKYKLCYTLMDTPDHLIEREAAYYLRENGYGFLEDNEDILQEFKDKMTYGEIPDELRIKVFDFEYDPEYIKELHKRVELCRGYINEKIKEL